MPYIKEERRKELIWNLRSIQETQVHLEGIANCGELNYVISEIIDQYIQTKGLKYDTLNEAIGVLECAKQELYRKVCAPYEDIKIKENGEVYTNVKQE